MSETVLAPPIRVGTRGSALALWQANHVSGLLRGLGHDVEIVVIKTQGDGSDVPFSSMPGKGFFTKEIEEALLASTIDVAVHSMKDLMTVQPPGLQLAALIGQADGRDMLIARADAVSRERLLAGDPIPLHDGVRVGTSAARRRAQLRALRPDLEVRELRGNVPTRLEKLRSSGDYDAIVLAKAGLDRLEIGFGDLWARPLEPADFAPAAAQGVLALQCRVGAPGSADTGLIDILGELQDADLVRPVVAERWLLAKLEGGCQVPFGCHIASVPTGYALDAFLLEEGRPPLRVHDEGEDPMTLASAAWDAIRAHRADA